MKTNSPGPRSWDSSVKWPGASAKMGVQCASNPVRDQLDNMNALNCIITCNTLRQLLLSLGPGLVYAPVGPPTRRVQLLHSYHTCHAGQELLPAKLTILGPHERHPDRILSLYQESQRAWAVSSGSLAGGQQRADRRWQWQVG